jgi:hypothetical protein
VTEPDGTQVIDSGEPAQYVNGAEVLHLPEAGMTIVTVHGHPQAGSWTVATQPGSPAISGISLRYGIPVPRVQARVTGSGTHRRLRYQIRPIPGQVVTFYEQSPLVGRQLGVTTKAKGSLPFPKGYGAPGKRQIFAIVTQDGVQRVRLPVTTWTAPKPPAVGRPGSLRATRSRGALVVRWHAVPGATRYRVLARFGDGQRHTREVKASHTRFAYFARTTSATISVTAIAGDEREGRPAVRQVKALRAKRAVLRA